MGMKAIDIRSRDIWAGLLIMAIAILFGVTAIDYPMGSPQRLDSGAFPVLLSALLFLLGLIMTLVGVVKGGAIGIEHWTWRGLLLIVIPPILFGFFVREIGLILCLFGVALLSAFASRMARAHVALILAAVLTLFCVGVFVYGLGLPIPLVGRWLQGQ
jgi:hypothetical protein